MTHYATQIYRLINGSHEHYTAERIFFEMKKIEPKIVLASVYNNLNALLEQGLIRKITMEHQADRYDRIKKHDHLICRTCGELADFDFGDLTENLKKQLHTDIFKYDLKVFYECPKCSQKNNL